MARARLSGIGKGNVSKLKSAVGVPSVKRLVHKRARPGVQAVSKRSK